MLPEDIQQQIIKDFNIESERLKVTKQLESLYTRILNVPPSQLARACLVVSNGSWILMQEIFKSGFKGDPRDLIMEAENVLGHPKHYCWEPFPYN